MNNEVIISVFVSLFVLFIALGFWSSRFRRGDMSDLGEWALAGRKLGGYLAWFLVGGDLYTAYTFIAIPELVYESGAIYFYAVPYVGMTFAVALITMPRLWKISKNKDYVTAVDMVGDKFNSKWLMIFIALTGIVAELPYIALQIYGMQAVLTVMIGEYVGSTSYVGLTEISLVVAFVILAAFTFTSGLRGATITAVMKDFIIFTTVIVVIVLVPYWMGGFGPALSNMAIQGPKTAASFKAPFTGSGQLANLFLSGFISLSIMSALALYLYPHAINGVLSTSSTKKLRYSTAFLPLYGVGLALLALFGVLIYDSSTALALVTKYGPVTVVPSLIYAYFPDWFVGFAFLGIFIGGLVPASIMAISQANLLTRNVIKPFRPNMDPKTEARLSKYFSIMFKFLALGFIFLISPLYSLQLQLVGGVIILQTLPAIFLAMYTKRLEKWSVGIGWLVGLAVGIFLLYYGNFVQLHKPALQTTFYVFIQQAGSPFYFLYVGLTAAAVNVVIAVVGSLIVGTFLHKTPREAPT
ncbi:MAG: sodium:solute symporter [Candidatus Thermoplasmatota archaeon]|jgi:SSS family solute:Na+ symporter|nr:sodium:solute symporter [Candidatus Thermoplasmatota archaeon]MCL5786507.1 sodium:solute symporter [Candidatus Thermoplasmatota archaeon]